uniref:Uncharacterized protein n=1 Tax=Amphimedon queenslandica TaxID=400682 RepID=A0A1X7STM1_AMPQE
MNFNAFIGRLDNDVNMKASAKLETGPTLTVTGKATARVLIKYKLGIEVSASISYTINPEASTSLCGSSSQDANACFEVYGTTRGNITVYAYRQSGRIRCKWLKCKNVSESCLYQYQAGMELGKGEQVYISAKVDISCESVGTFNKELSIRSCMQVRDSVITKTSEDSN